MQQISTLERLDFFVVLDLNLVSKRTLECYSRCGVYKMMTNLNMNSLDILHT